jgi:hypothetical protein
MDMQDPRLSFIINNLHRRLNYLRRTIIQTTILRLTVSRRHRQLHMVRLSRINKALTSLNLRCLKVLHHSSGKVVHSMHRLHIKAMVVAGVEAVEGHQVVEAMKRH